MAVIGGNVGALIITDSFVVYNAGDQISAATMDSQLFKSGSTLCPIWLGSHSDNPEPNYGTGGGFDAQIDRTKYPGQVKIHYSNGEDITDQICFASGVSFLGWVGRALAAKDKIVFDIWSALRRFSGASEDTPDCLGLVIGGSAAAVDAVCLSVYAKRGATTSVAAIKTHAKVSITAVGTNVYVKNDDIVKRSVYASFLRLY